MNITHNHIQLEFDRLFKSLSDNDKRAIYNYIFNFGLPGYVNFLKPQNGQRYGQWFLNNVPIELDEPFSSIFYGEDSYFMKEQIQSFAQKIINEPIQEE